MKQATRNCVVRDDKKFKIKLWRWGTSLLNKIVYSVVHSQKEASWYLVSHVNVPIINDTETKYIMKTVINK